MDSVRNTTYNIIPYVGISENILEIYAGHDP